MTTTYYDTTYGNFQTSLYQEIRREAYGEDIGQNGWLTSDEQNKFIGWLGLTAGKTLLDVACGAGGPALRIAALTMRARPIEAHTQYEYGAMLRARGRPEERVKADALLDQAIATATELGMAKIVYDAHLLTRLSSRPDLLQTLTCPWT